MQLNEVIKEVGMTKRAVKYYEEKGLLSITKDKTVTVITLLKMWKPFKKIYISQAWDQCE